MIEQGALSVRPLKHSDAPMLYTWLNDSRVLAFYEGRDRPQDMEMIERRFLSKTDIRDVLGCLVSWEQQPVGYVQVYPISNEERALYSYTKGEAVFGMDQFIGEPQLWNQGIGTYLVDMVSTWLHQSAGADYVVMDPRVDNVRAIHVYEKCGFKKVKRLPQRELHEGTYHDCWLMERWFTKSATHRE